MAGVEVENGRWEMRANVKPGGVSKQAFTTLQRCFFCPPDFLRRVPGTRAPRTELKAKYLESPSVGAGVGCVTGVRGEKMSA